ncbi:hypothetical protein [Solilutibacter silvestris]|uniref:Uncharacterized protein n=1 Tax=Solilutibacter silvestris TaxID=1645665 RepID=A0A2K1Q0H8_9GAMM|nr:hypothetical protein [Lysobacter silvestris]PNS08545.1 hypothetical protein Lysil_0174 [Lysobacter silvestris]
MTRRTWLSLAGVAVLTAAALLSTWVGEWRRRAGDDAPRITTEALAPATLPKDGGQASSARGELTPDDRDATVVRDLEFLSWYAHRREAGTAATAPLDTTPETMGESDEPAAADAH